jgi:hypothetical protein
MLTRTWFHTGAFEEALAVSQQYANEFWIEPALRGLQPPSMLLPDTVIPPVLNPFLKRAKPGTMERSSQPSCRLWISTICPPA